MKRFFFWPRDRACHCGRQASAAPGAPAHASGRGIGGQVASVAGTTITVTTRDGTAKIATSSTTTFEVNGARATRRLFC